MKQLNPLFGACDNCGNTAPLQETDHPGTVFMLGDGSVGGDAMWIETIRIAPTGNVLFYYVKQFVCSKMCRDSIMMKSLI